MKSCLLMLLSFFIPLIAYAQKNVIPANQITALNLKLPNGSKQDKRFLSTVAAASLLETEVNDPSVSISEVEVYTLPPTTQSGFDAEVLVGELEKSGFEILPTNDNRIAWLVKGQNAFLIFISMDNDETNFYIGRSNKIPKTAQTPSTGQAPSNVTHSTIPAYIPPLPPSRSKTSPPMSQQVPAPNPPAKSHSPSQNPPSNSSVPKTPVAPFTGFQFTTSNFDDGWVSTIHPDWVLVQKGETKVYLFFVLPYQSEIFDGTGVMDRDFYWDNHVAPIFKTTSKSYQDAGEFISSFKPKYVEGWGQDPQTGERRFFGMYLTVSPNAVMLTMASTLDENGLRQQFPIAADRWTSDLAAMSRYNKFAIGPNDLNGTWQSGGSQMTQWYNEVTGAYAGATVAATIATFNFSGNTYTRIHNGATGFIGAMNTFQQEFKGATKIKEWNISMTNRFEGKTHDFNAHFQTVKGGRLLYLNNQTGEEYLLVKIK
ncbi:hypothetical protein [Shivajiella indica]|uniref:DUF3472 domain-containing protein n=1 Tax=Shivajiella indica TaxID=872115 RepID=A0ABW5B768_9BACT